MSLGGVASKDARVSTRVGNRTVRNQEVCVATFLLFPFYNEMKDKLCLPKLHVCRGRVQGVYTLGADSWDFKTGVSKVP